MRPPTPYDRTLAALAADLTQALAALEHWAARTGEGRADAAVARRRRLLRQLQRAGIRIPATPPRPLPGLVPDLVALDLARAEWRLARASALALARWPRDSAEAALLSALRDDCEQVALMLQGSMRS